jgi:hypothetical protein
MGCAQGLIAVSTLNSAAALILESPLDRLDLCLDTSYAVEKLLLLANCVAHGHLRYTLSGLPTTFQKERL